MIDRFVDAHDGIRLAVRDHGGDGPAMVLMHGAGMHLLWLEQLVAHLPDLRIVTMDARWCGWSGDSPTYDWVDLVRDVESVVEALDLGNPVVAGHSWGGMIAAHDGAAHPEAPAVINLDGHGSGDPAHYDGLSDDEIAAALALIEAINDASLPPATEGDAAWHATARTETLERYRAMRVPEDQLDEWVDRTFVERGDGTWVARPSPVMMTGLRGDLRLFDVYRRVRCPMLILSCTKAQRSLPEQVNELMAAYRRGLGRVLAELASEHPNIEISVHDDIDHNSIAGRHAPVVADVMRRFIERRTTASR